MSDSTPASETIILLDHRPLFDEVIRDVSRSKAAIEIFGDRPKPLPSGGNGFAQSTRFVVGDRVFNFLHLNPEDAHLLGYLTLAQRAQTTHITRILCIAQATALDDTLHTGDIAVVAEAVALPYPALYESRPPAWQEDSAADKLRHTPGIYPAPVSALSMVDQLTADVLPHIPQNTIPAIRTGYAKHPTHGGALAPWAHEQFDQLRAGGLHALSETAVGVYDFASRNPETPVLCYNFMTSSEPSQTISTTQASHALLRSFLQKV